MGFTETISKRRQMILLVVGLFPGILAFTEVISGATATLSLIVLFVISRRFASAKQKQWEQKEADRLIQEEKLAAVAERKGKGKGKGKAG